MNPLQLILIMPLSVFISIAGIMTVFRVVLPLLAWNRGRKTR